MSEALGFRLTLPESDAPAQVVRSGPVNVTQIGIGRPTEALPKLAALVFPVCARAQAAAALSAIEHASGIELTRVQASARNAVVLAEALAASIWRAALTWPTLIGNPGHPSFVKTARAASESIERNIFEDDWKQPGGGTVRFDAGALRETVQLYEQIINQLDAPVRAFLPLAQQSLSISVPPVGEQLLNANLAPRSIVGEETPRSLIYDAAPARCLSDWFRAQWQHTQSLLDDLRTCLVRLEQEAAPQIELTDTGVGTGIVMTSRGRLRHVVEVDAGLVVRWDVTAPTDWNMAPDGLLAELIMNLDLTKDPSAQAKWAIAAVDPCAPCTVEPVREVTYA